MDQTSFCKRVHIFKNLFFIGLSVFIISCSTPDIAFASGNEQFEARFKSINWETYHQNDPFKMSGLALYKWSPIAENLKTLDKEIVLNSIKYKWNSVNEFSFSRYSYDQI